jgi:hypothetical protein
MARFLIGLSFCLLTAIAVPAQAQDVIALAKRVSVAALDSTLPAVSLESWLRELGRVPASAITWEVNDCGEGGDGLLAPTCAEAMLPLKADTTAHISLIVGGLDGTPAEPAVWDLSVGTGNTFTGFKTLREWAAQVRRRGR